MTCQSRKPHEAPPGTRPTVNKMQETVDGYVLELMINREGAVEAAEHAVLKAMHKEYTPPGGGTFNPCCFLCGPFRGEITYDKIARGDWGHRHPTKAYGLARLGHDARHTLCHGFADQLSVVDAEVAALQHLAASRHSWVCPCLTTMRNTERYDLLCQLQLAYGLERPRQVEELLFKLLYTEGLPIGHKAPTRDIKAGLVCGGRNLRLPQRTPGADQAGLSTWSCCGARCGSLHSTWIWRTGTPPRPRGSSGASR